MIKIKPAAFCDDAEDLTPFPSVQDQCKVHSEFPDYLQDESKLTGFADAIFWVQSERQASNLLKEANVEGTALTISGGRTGIVGGAVPQGGWLVSMERMKRLKSVQWNEDRSAWLARIEPGMTLKELESNIVNAKCSGATPSRWIEDSQKWFYPPDPTEKTAQIGGTIATNASGSRSLAYGQTRPWISAIRVLLADGTPIELIRGENLIDLDGSVSIETLTDQLQFEIPNVSFPSVKHAAGYRLNRPMDLIDLFIGSEGTLGLISEAELVLSPKPEGLFSGLAFFESSISAIEFVVRARRGIQSSEHILRPNALEYFDSRTIQLLNDSPSVSFPSTTLKGAAVYFEQEFDEIGFDTALDVYDHTLKQFGTSIDHVWGAFDDSERDKLTAFRHAVPENVNRIIAERQIVFPSIHKVGTDFVVPDGYLKNMMDLYETVCQAEGLDYVIFGHIGENHLHVNILPRNPREMDAAKKIYAQWAVQAVAWGGSVSGEHGIGKIKRYLMGIQYDSNSLDKMRKIKKLLDPKGILCQGNLFL